MSHVPVHNTSAGSKQQGRLEEGAVVLLYIWYLGISLQYRKGKAYGYLTEQKRKAPPILKSGQYIKGNASCAF